MILKSHFYHKKSKALFFFCLIFNLSYAQTGSISIQDIGSKSYAQVKNSQQGYPCEETYPKILVYCVQDKSKISYIFNNGILDGIGFATPYSNRYDADRELNNLIRSQKQKTTVEPIVSGGKTIFYQAGLKVAIQYSVEYADGKYYTLMYVFNHHY